MAVKIAFRKLHYSVRFLTISTLFGLVSLTTPCWALFETNDGENWVYFGLFHLCLKVDACDYIGDYTENIPLWYKLLSGAFGLGVSTCLLCLIVLMGHKTRIGLRMTLAGRKVVAIILIFAISQELLALYLFGMHLQDVGEFLVHSPKYLDLNGSFYAGIVSAFLCLCSVISLCIDDSIICIEERCQWYSPTRSDNGYSYERLNQ